MTKVAERLGVTRSAIWLIVNNERGVGLALSKKIEAEFQIPHNAWIKPSAA